MTNWPLVSIITPSYNQGKFIEATIGSVLSQGYPNLEYIIVDGGSTDDSLSIIQKYNGQLTWVSERDKGQSNAINKGFRMAKGEIVAWLNSDDTYEPGAIHEAVEYFKRHDVALVYGEGDIIDEYGQKVKRFEATQRFDLWTLVYGWDYIMQPTTFFKKDALATVGYLDEDLHWTMDWDLWIKLAKKYEVGYINKVLANSREYGDSKTSTGGWKRFGEICTILRKYGEKRFPPGYFSYGASTLYTNNAHYRLGKVITSKILYWVQIYFQWKLRTKRNAI
ncbi:MAG: glycosyltransferase family 2 protein [Syntrophorhabdaceae bacterium]